MEPPQSSIGTTRNTLVPYLVYYMFKTRVDENDDGGAGIDTF